MEVQLVRGVVDETGFLVILVYAIERIVCSID